MENKLGLKQPLLGEKMIRYIFITILAISTLTAATINVPEDYSTIQEGINASVEGDTVLVAQGNYVENLVLEKEIVLASYALLDQSLQDIDWTNNIHVTNTRIMGGSPTNSKKGSCIQVSYGNIQPTIMGFTISDGVGTSMLINDCDATRVERSGGAIMAYQAFPIVTYNRFLNNGVSTSDNDNAVQSVQNGGGITLYNDDDVEFDEDRTNSGQNTNTSRDIPETWNVQNNYFENNSSANGENFYTRGFAGIIDVSGSVFENINCEQGTVNEFVLHSVENEAEYLTNDISGLCLDQNVYFVNPVSGDDQNSGLEESPFKTIRHALTMIKKGDDNTTTIYLSAGRYSSTDNGEIFPIVLPDNVHLIGDDSQTTMLDANASQDEEAGVMIIPENENVKVANMTLRRGYSENHGCAGGGALLVTSDDMISLDWDMQPNNAILENLILENSHSKNGGGLSFFNVDGPTVTNVVVRNNSALMQGGGINVYSSSVDMSNVEIHDNYCVGTYYQGMDDFGHGGGLFLNETSGNFDEIKIYNNSAAMNGGGIWSSFSSGWTLTNSDVSDNYAPTAGGGLALWDNNGNSGESPVFENVTVNNNTSQADGGAAFGFNSNPTFENCTFNSNTSGFRGGGAYFNGGSYLEFQNCEIIGNSANIGGGFMLEGEAGFWMNKTLVVGNTANQSVGAIGLGSSGTKWITNSTISGNDGPNAGGVQIWNGDVGVINSILWNNTPANDYMNVGGGSAIAIYSTIGGGWDGDGNLDSDPLFKDPDNGDFTLSQDSPCKDAGIADWDDDGVDDVTDYNGSAPDMGAFESQMAAPSNFSLFPSTDYVIVSWLETEEEGLQYYLLERSTDSEFNENVVSNFLITSYFEDYDLEFNTEYFYRVSFNAGEWSEYSEVLAVTLEQLNVGGHSQLPGEYALHQNYPNPFNPVTNLNYDLPEDAMVNITIYDMMGKVVASLVDGQQSAGFKTLQWDATNQSGMPISAGLYIYTIQAGDFNQTRKMILLK